MRKIKDNLLKRLLTGDLAPLLNHIKTDPELRFEVRPKGEAFVYYRKGKALEVGSLKVDKKYGNVPSTNLAIEDPALYFEKIKRTIDNWLVRNNRPEFDTQQRIAQCNQDIDDKYIIIDMEYAFERNQIEESQRSKRAVFDLLGIEKRTNKVILFEVKRGMGATKGSSGISDHINDFNTYINGKNRSIYRNNLFQDVKNIISDKLQLGLISNYDLPQKISKEDPEFVFIFHSEDEIEVLEFEYELQNRHKLIIVNDSDFKLR